MLKLRKGGHKDLEKYYGLMEIDFDSEELFSKLTIHKAMLNSDMELVVFYDDETKMEVGYALVLLKNLYGYVLLKYMAVMPWYRGKGFGIELMRQINKRYAHTQGILAELTEFPDEDADRLRKLRKFFSRFGYEEVAIDYKISGTKANLYVKPICGTAEIGSVAHRIVRDFYVRCLNAFALERMIDIGGRERK